MATADRIDDNLSLVATPEEVDRVNGRFYSKFPYPWRAKSLDCTADEDFARVMLNQNLGDWTHQTVPRNPRIWVAGCGTNQAPLTALNFSQGSVRGSDVSSSSLNISAAAAKGVGCTNLELKEESINQADYREEFDFIICTGVIHHNADPEATLLKLARALKPAGVLELMVYNRYHRILTSAFQKAIRLLAGTEAVFDYQKEFSLTRSLIDGFPGDGLMHQFVAGFKEVPDMVIADSLMQPVENSYTVEVLEEMARRCGLEYVTPSPATSDKGSGRSRWNMHFSQSEIQKIYNALPDSRRWQIANLLLCENSPMLWFYFKRADSPVERKSEQQICESFLKTRFRQNAVTRRSYVLNDDDTFTPVDSATPYPGMPAKPELRRIVQATSHGAPMGRILDSLRVPRDFTTINELRLQLATSEWPFLRAV